MNYYKLFYWLTVADGVKSFFDTFSNIFTFLTVLSLIAYVLLLLVYVAMKHENEDEEELAPVRLWIKHVKNIFLTSTALCLITWAGYVFTPNKKDSLIIIAGGAVGNFITRDTAARQLPTEVLNLLRVKIREEINSTNVSGEKKKLEDLTKEELIEVIKEKDSKE